MIKSRILGTIIASSVFAMSSFALDLPANKLVNATWLKSNMADKSLVIVDIREDDKAYKAGHIPGAIRWATKDFRESRYKDVPGYLPAPITFTRLMKKSGITKDSNVVFYSDGTEKGSYTIAGLGVFVAEYYGFKNTAVLNGGMSAWKAAGNAVNNKKVKIKKSNWKITSMAKNNVAYIGDIDEAVTLDSVQLVDSRGDAQVNGTKKHPKVLKKGHVPGAKHLFVGNFTKTVDGTVFLNPEGAKAAAKAAKVNLDEPMIWYCNTSWYASGAWFAGKYLAGASNSKVYDGSMVDYSRAPKRKMVKGDIK